MISLKEAFGLCRVKDSDVVFLRKWNASRFDYQFMTVKIVKEQYDMKATKVLWVQPRFEMCGPDFLGMEFGIYCEVK